MFADLDRCTRRSASNSASRKDELWHGKATIVVFSTHDVFARFEKVVMEFRVSESSKRLPPELNNGDALVACALGDDADESTRSLVRNTARCYLYRYRSNVYLPDWIGEGIASWVAAGVTGDKAFRDPPAPRRRHRPHQGPPGRLLRRRAFSRGLESGSRGEHCRATVQNRCPGLSAIGTGDQGRPDLEESLQDAYGLSPAELAQLYGEHIGAPNLKP